MTYRRAALVTAVFALSMVLAGFAGAVPPKGSQVPAFRAVDIQGREVDLDKLVQADPKPDLLILFFFTTSTGEEIALKLRRLDQLYRDKLRTVAIGWKEDEAALKKFAEEMDIQYFVIRDTPELAAEQKYGPFESLPYTFIVTDQKTVLYALSGSGQSEADLINDVATSFFRKGKYAEAQSVAQEAIAAGEPEKEARNTIGFALTAEGKLDDAVAEFGKIDSKEGLAKVAAERGEYDKAVAIADEAGADNGYAQTVKGEALMRSGKIDEAATTLEAAAQKPANDWQKSEASNALGRVQHQQGNVGGAISNYQQAVTIDPLNVVALSNEGAAHREKGDLKKATEVLEKAKTVRDDELVTLMLQQVQQELKEANDVKRGELIRAQINDLRERYDALKAAGKDKPVDEWTSPPLILAFLPSTNAQPAFLERAGMDVVLRREIEMRLQGSGAVKVVEREVLDKLLQELQLGSSDIANPDTQLQLGKVLSARMLGFTDLGAIGPDTMVYVRLVDTETTSLAAQLTRNLKDFANLQAMVDDLVREMGGKIVDGRTLQGLIADAPADDGIIINLGKQHGVKAGDTFNAVEKGEPIQAGGKTLGYRETKVALLEVTQVEDQYSIAKASSKKEGVQLAKEMKVKQVKK